MDPAIASFGDSRFFFAQRWTEPRFWLKVKLFALPDLKRAMPP
jgi:hypothetical protein